MHYSIQQMVTATQFAEPVYEEEVVEDDGFNPEDIHHSGWVKLVTEDGEEYYENVKTGA